MGGNICLRLKKTRRMRTLRNFPLAINKRLGLRILVTEEQCEPYLEDKRELVNDSEKFEVRIRLLLIYFPFCLSTACKCCV